MTDIVLKLFTLIVTSSLIAAMPGGHSPECRSLMDVILVVDGSDSISEVDYNKQRAALANLMSEIDIGPGKTKAGIVVYSTGIAQVVELTDDKQYLVTEARNLVHPRDGTKTHEGIATMRKLFEKGGRPGVPLVCIVITDGISKNPNMTATEAELARKMGVNMFAVGISHDIKQQELEAIASTPEQVLMLTSFDQLSVSLSSLMKVVCPCPPPPHIPFAIIDDGTRAIGSTRTYTCEAGYQTVGKATMTCNKDATWTTIDLQCLACPEPMPEFGNAIITGGPVLLNSTRQYVCKGGYVSPEPLFISCVPGPSGPQWTDLPAVCSGCPYPPEVPNAYPDAPPAEIGIGTSFRYACNAGFMPTGPIEITCLDDNGFPKWTPLKNKCIACGPPPLIPNAHVDLKGNTNIGSVRIYACQKGFHATGPIEAVCIGDKGMAFWKTTDHACIGCAEPPEVANAVAVKGGAGANLVGSVTVYTCLKGYQATGPLEALCIGNNGFAHWDGPNHVCVACGAPPVIPKAVVNPNGDTLVGSVRQYECMKGYMPTGPIEVGCIVGTGSPIWTSPEYHCVACEAPPQIPNAILTGPMDGLIGSVLTYQCLKGFVPSKAGAITVTCIGEYIDNIGRAFWSVPSHECIACPLPPPLEFANVLPGDNLIGSIRKYECEEGFHPTGPVLTKCMENGQWSKPDHTCSACGPLPNVPNAQVTEGSHVIGSVRIYRCAPGFVPNAPPKIACLPGAKWGPVEFMCITCMDPYPVNNAVLEPGNNLVGSVRRYTCMPGFLATGPITSSCAVSSDSTAPDWSTPVHFCKDCGDPVPIEFADIMPGPRVIGSTVNYKCQAGFVPTGPPLSHCLPNAMWSLPDFKCIKPNQDIKKETPKVWKYGIPRWRSTKKSGPVELQTFTSNKDGAIASKTGDIVPNIGGNDMLSRHGGFPWKQFEMATKFDKGSMYPFPPSLHKMHKMKYSMKHFWKKHKYRAQSALLFSGQPLMANSWVPAWT